MLAVACRRDSAAAVQRVLSSQDAAASQPPPAARRAVAAHAPALAAADTFCRILLCAPRLVCGAPNRYAEPVPMVAHSLLMHSRLCAPAGRRRPLRSRSRPGRPPPSPICPPGGLSRTAFLLTRIHPCTLRSRQPVVAGTRCRRAAQGPTSSCSSSRNSSSAPQPAPWSSSPHAGRSSSVLGRAPPARVLHPYLRSARRPDASLPLHASFRATLSPPAAWLAQAPASAH